MAVLPPSPLRTAHPALAALHHHLNKRLHPVYQNATDRLNDLCLQHAVSVLAYDLTPPGGCSARIQGNLILLRSHRRQPPIQHRASDLYTQVLLQYAPLGPSAIGEQLLTSTPGALAQFYAQVTLTIHGPSPQRPRLTR